MFLLMVFLLLMVVLSAAIYGLAVFFQGYIYTQPIAGLAWRAPAAAAVMSTYFTIWCAFVVNGDCAPGDLNYDTIFRFSPEVSKLKKPALKLRAIRADGTATDYKHRKNDAMMDEYRDAKKGAPFNPTGVVTIELTVDGNVMQFKKAPRGERDNDTFQTEDGWTMHVFSPSGPSGIPYQSSWGRFFGNMFLNALHAVLWFLCLWLLLQFRFNDALGFTVVIWLVATLALPVVLDEAAFRARAANAAPIDRSADVRLHAAANRA